MDNLLFLDTETTQLELGEVIQLACGDYRHESIKTHLFGSEKEIDIEAMATHHITDKMIAGKPKFGVSQAIIELQESLGKDTILVAHNAKFDIKALGWHDVTVGKFICTMKVAKYLFQKNEQVKRFGLQYLRYRFNLKFDQDIKPHDAHDDVVVLIELFKYLVEYSRTLSATITEAEIIDTFVKISSRPLLLYKVNFGKYKDKTWEEAGKDKNYLQWIVEKGAELMNDEDIAFTVKHYLSK